MKFRLPAAFVFGACVLTGVGGARPAARPVFAAAPLPPLLGGGAKPAAAAPRRVVQVALRIEQFTSAEPAANAPAPTVLGKPILSTLDRDTGTIAVSSPAFGYSVAVSPVVEAAASGSPAGTPPTVVQASWNVRLNGKNLPAGTTMVTMTGATRLVTSKEAVLTEITLRDADTGKPTTYRIWAKAALPDAAPAATP